MVTQTPWGEEPGVLDPGEVKNTPAARQGRAGHGRGVRMPRRSVDRVGFCGTEGTFCFL